MSGEVYLPKSTMPFCLSCDIANYEPKNVYIQLCNDCSTTRFVLVSFHEVLSSVIAKPERKNPKCLSM